MFERKLLSPITLENGAVYTGEWKNGMRDGKGIQVWPDESKYEGQWLGKKLLNEFLMKKITIKLFFNQIIIIKKH